MCCRSHQPELSSFGFPGQYVQGLRRNDCDDDGNDHTDNIRHIIADNFGHDDSHLIGNNDSNDNGVQLEVCLL